MQPPSITSALARALPPGSTQDWTTILAVLREQPRCGAQLKILGPFRNPHYPVSSFHRFRNTERALNPPFLAKSTHPNAV